jgi:hypothetical protein
MVSTKIPSSAYGIANVVPTTKVTAAHRQLPRAGLTEDPQLPNHSGHPGPSIQTQQIETGSPAFVAMPPASDRHGGPGASPLPGGGSAA